MKRYYEVYYISSDGYHICYKRPLTKTAAKRIAAACNAITDPYLWHTGYHYSQVPSPLPLFRIQQLKNTKSYRQYEHRFKLEHERRQAQKS